MYRNVLASPLCKALTTFSHVQTGSAYRDLLIDRACFLPVESTSAIESENVTGPMVRSALWFYTEETNAQGVAEAGLKTRFFFTAGSLFFPLVTLIT